MARLIKDNQERLNQKAAEIIAKHLALVYEKHGQAVLAVPGGRSVSGIFARLAEQELDWNKVKVFLVDERLVPLGASDCNFNLVDEYLTGPLTKNKKMSVANVHPFVFQPHADDLGLTALQQELETCGGKYDVVLLSAGEDGHVGGLYPGHHSVTDPAEFFISMDDSPKPPAARMSSSLKLLQRSGLAVLLFYGEAKRAALAKFSDPNVSLYDCPAKLVNDLPEAIILTDLQ